jgi:teichuronic acid biosynthesis glycosyltransferase TuaG
LIVIDDGSIECSREIIERMRAEDGRIRLICRDRASGSPAIPRNLGLDAAQGRFIAFLDCDDAWLPDKLERQLRLMADKKAVASYTAYLRIRENGTLLRRISVPESMSYGDLLKNTAIAASSVILNRDTIRNERFLQVGHEDYEYWLRLAKKYGRFIGLDEVLLKYRVVDGSVSSKRLRTISWTWQIYRRNQGLSLPRAMWCIANYGLRAAMKRL